jgi:hypothetical protein
MTSAEVIERLKTAPNRQRVAEATGIQYGYLSKLVYGLIKNPGSAQIDTLRDYFQRELPQ